MLIASSLNSKRDLGFHSPPDGQEDGFEALPIAATSIRTWLSRECFLFDHFRRARFEEENPLETLHQGDLHAWESAKGAIHGARARDESNRLQIGGVGFSSVKRLAR
jgi:hypothetical protein